MSELSVNRTLVKSPPELWAELSEAERLRAHLGEFGEIRLTKVEPEKAVAWEGEHGSGTVEIVASGWGTKVTLTAELPVSEAAKADSDAPGATEPQASLPRAEHEAHARIAAPEADAREPDAQPAPAERGPVGPAAGGRQPEAPTPAPPSRPGRRGILARLFGRRAPEPQARQPAAAWSPPLPPPPPPMPPSQTSAASSRAHEAPSATPAGTAAVTTSARRTAEAPRPQPAPAGPALDAQRALAVLEDALDTLGAAHHRPFSRD